MSNTMAKVILVLYLTRCFSNNHALPQRGPTPLPFPHLIDFNISDIGKPVHIFEGVDYDELPKNLRDEYSNNCYSEHYKCIRSRSHFTPVCAYDSRDWRFKEYYSHCELDFQNCLLMVKAGTGMYGRLYQDRYIYFVGEGYKCEFYVRSNTNMNNSTKSSS